MMDFVCLGIGLLVGYVIGESDAKSKSKQDELNITIEELDAHLKYLRED